MPILVEIEAEKQTPPPPRPDDGFDFQDGLIAAGILFAEAFALVTWWPAALILAAAFCLVFAYLIERDKPKT
jgi:hypothetical protein